MQGKGVEKDEDEALRYLKIGVEKEYMNCIYLYADLLYDKDNEQAAKYFKMSADKGHRDAMLRYSEMLKNGKGVEKDENEHMRYFKMELQDGALENADIGCGVQ